MASAEITSPRVRFAPSPTGYLHVGGARTALFNWLFARHYAKTAGGGTFILRIEDTDFERSSEAMVAGILEGMRWLGMDWDEGPFFQSQRLPLYKVTAERLVAAGAAYPCFCTKAELEARRADATAAGRPPMYDRRCRSLSKEQAAERTANGEPATLRFAVPLEGSTSWNDAVFGKLEFANAELEDFVLLRSDGIPTYHLSVVADDVDMRMTHVIRGADHISNTPKQVLQYRALGAPEPIFAHVPLILGPDKTRLSKRHGATSVTAYKDMGIVPEAFRNFLALLGWTPQNVAAGSDGKTREVFSTEELVGLFTLDGISKSPAVFGNDKLAWFNTEYIRAYPTEKLLQMVREEWARAGVTVTKAESELALLLDLLKPRARSLLDFATVFRAYFTDDFEFDAAAVTKFLSSAETRTQLAELAARYEQDAEFTEASTEATLREFAGQLGIKPGVLINGARVALTGQGIAPSLFAVMVALGKDRVVTRLKAAPQIALPEAESATATAPSA